MTADIDLYGDRTGNCLRTAIALEEADLPYNLHYVSLWRRAHQRSDFVALNRFGKVPVLVDRRGDTPLVLTQSNAIIMYVAEMAPERLLPMQSPRERARFYELMFYFVTDVIAPKHAAMHLMSMGTSQGQDAFILRAAHHLEEAESFLGDEPFMLGGRFSVIDIIALTAASTLEYAIDWVSVPRFRRWFDLVSQRPAVMRGMGAFDAVRTTSIP